MKSRIGYWIEIRGYKKVWVAKQIGVSHVVLSRWINDVSIPSLVNCFKLADLLNCKVDDLYERTSK
ncbi:helix-turn-helix transcriptional regulator [Virgibacillus ndiopensis]|uniref:helix-turn-helix transcriptional regulator n=1 Tax=Virgibacillus ndiopensis TaxID=2004408 RepID=UPI000C07B315|nr:helix-turn-helix transcriptional regulator [Virgibacillus ndiopensis]